jgi:hypothetical protein
MCLSGGETRNLSGDLKRADLSATVMELEGHYVRGAVAVRIADYKEQISRLSISSDPQAYLQQVSTRTGGFRSSGALVDFNGAWFRAEMEDRELGGTRYAVVAKLERYP